MQIRVKGLPVRFDMNGWMAAGFGLALVGVAAWVAGWLGAYPRGTVLDTVALGLAILGMALYFVGRLIDIVGHLRKKP